MCIRDRRRGVLEHGIPDEPMVDDGEELRPCWHGGPLNGGGKVFERLIRDLEAAGAPADFFRGKCYQEVLRDIADVLQIEKLANCLLYTSQDQGRARCNDRGRLCAV